MSNEKKTKAKCALKIPYGRQAITHISLWFIIIVTPYIIFSSHISDTKSILNYIFSFSSSIVVFYANYLLLINKFLYNKRVFLYILLNAILIAISIYVTYMIRLKFNLFFLPPKMLESGRTALFSLVYCFKESIVLLAIAALSLALKSTSRWFNSESERQQMKKEHLESELNNLKSQINPHFLFNTLNNIYSLTITNTDKAQYSIKELSNMLRYVLYESNQIVVPLRKELDFIRNFINLMTLRLSENVKLTVDIRQQVEPNIMIAPLLFIALVENAFKHGLKSAHNSFIDIKIKIENNYIVCFVANSNYPTNNENKVDSGVGLDNLNKRLKLLYPSGYSFIIEDKENVYSSTLKIRLSN